MRVINCKVIEVITEPVEKNIEGDSYNLKWWEIKVSYKVKGVSDIFNTVLTFKTQTECKLIGSGYEFIMVV